LLLTFAASFAETLTGALVLWRRPGMSLRSLRLWELFLFAVHAGSSGYGRFEALAYTSEAARIVQQLIGFSGLATLQEFITLILAYGVLIPNTRRRGLVVVAALAAVPFAIIPAAAVNPLLRAGHVPVLFIQCAMILTFPAAIAVFAARNVALQTPSGCMTTAGRTTGRSTTSWSSSTGRRWRGWSGKPGRLLAAHRTEPPPALTDLRPDVPTDLAAVVARCLAKDPAGRFQTAAELDRALAGCGCAADWSAERATGWWVAVAVGKPTAAEPTRTFA
jgi:hypothetical protein